MDKPSRLSKSNRQDDCLLSIDSPPSTKDYKLYDEPKPNTAEEVKTLLKLVGPVTITTLREFLPGFVAVTLAGNIDSPYAQHYIDAATFSIMLINLSSFSVGFGLAAALDTLCSQAYGAKRFEKIGVYFQTGVVVLGAILLPVFTINWFTEDILLLLGQDAEVSPCLRLKIKLGLGRNVKLQRAAWRRPVRRTGATAHTRGTYELRRGLRQAILLAWRTGHKPQVGEGTRSRLHEDWI